MVVTLFICVFIFYWFVRTWAGLKNAKKVFENQKAKYEKKINEAIYQSANVENYNMYTNGPIINANMINDMENEFNENLADYNKWYQFISLFPMLGILGTVIGLMISLKDGSINDISSMWTALITTLVGLSAAIILKIYDSSLVYKSACGFQNILTRLNNIYDKQVQNQTIINLNREKKDER